MKWVYFIKPIGMDGPIKIGCSYSPDFRRKTLETWSPFPLEIVAEWEGGAVVERQFHALFSSSHIHHEWFSVSDELLSTIEQIKAGVFDGAALPDPQQLPRKAKDTSYMTAGWKYWRSIVSRVDHIAGQVDPDALKGRWVKYPEGLDKFDEVAVSAIRPGIEAQIEALRIHAETLPRRNLRRAA